MVAPPFQRFYLGGENDIRGFDILTVSPVAFLPSKSSIALRNPDGTVVPKDPTNPLRGSYTVPVPVERIVFPGGDASLVTNLEYRITIAGPVALAPFMDLGMNPVIRGSQLRINSGQLADINNTVFGCPALDIALNCTGGNLQSPPFSQNLQVVSSTNWKPRMSTGLELQVFLPIVNAPFRVYWAYNPLRLDNVTRARSPLRATCSRRAQRGILPSSRLPGVWRPSINCASRARRFASAWRRRSEGQSSVVSRQQFSADDRRLTTDVRRLVDLKRRVYL